MMKTCKFRHGVYVLLVLLPFSAFSFNYPDTLKPKPFVFPNWWISLGYMKESIYPNGLPILGKRTFEGLEAVLSMEYKHFVFSAGASTTGNGGTGDIFADDYSEINACSFTIGRRIPFDYGWLIPSIGICAGNYHITTADLGPNPAPPPSSSGFNFNLAGENYAHSNATFIGIPIRVSYMLGGRYAGIALGAYYQAHAYAQAGFNVYVALGKLRPKKIL